MRTKFKLTMLFIATFVVLAVGCSSDDNGSVAVVDPTCTDGIKNGDETGIDCGGTCTPCGDAVLEGTLEENRTLSADITYSLKGTFSVASGNTLTIPAGTKIVANVESGDQTSTYIVVQKGAKINVQGTATDPVIMTSANEKPGDWGGLVIAGDATTTAGANATAEVGRIVYGGNNDTDNSGSISHLIINYAGAQINAESQFNGLTLYAVGSGTSISNVAVMNGTDDGVEFFGGTVSASNIYLENNEDDSVDWTEGWNGTLTDTYVIHSNAGFSTAIEADGANNNPTIVNFTAISTVGGTALQFKKTSGGTFTNVSLSGYATNVDMSDNGPVSNIIVDEIPLTTATDDVLNGTPVDVALFAWAISL